MRTERKSVKKRINYNVTGSMALMCVQYLISLIKDYGLCSNISGGEKI